MITWFCLNKGQGRCKFVQSFMAMLVRNLEVGISTWSLIYTNLPNIDWKVNQKAVNGLPMLIVMI